jgi:hypothetical protein
MVRLVTAAGMLALAAQAEYISMPIDSSSGLYVSSYDHYYYFAYGMIPDGMHVQMHFNYFDMEANFDGVVLSFGGDAFLFTGQQQAAASASDKNLNRYWHDQYNLPITDAMSWSGCAPVNESPWIRMYSDGSVAYTGFQLEWNLVSDCSGSWDVAPYSNNQVSNFSMQAPTNRPIQLSFNMLDLESCCDGVRLLVDGVQYLFSGYHGSSASVSDNKAMTNKYWGEYFSSYSEHQYMPLEWVGCAYSSVEGDFQSDGSVTGAGFNLNWQYVDYCTPNVPAQSGNWAVTPYGNYASETFNMDVGRMAER